MSATLRSIFDILTFKAIAGELPDAHVMQGASNVPAVQPRVGERNALRSKLSDPLLNSGTLEPIEGLGDQEPYQLRSCTWLHWLVYFVPRFSR